MKSDKWIDLTGMTPEELELEERMFIARQMIGLMTAQEAAALVAYLERKTREAEQHEAH
jgi:hypothetical protein